MSYPFVKAGAPSYGPRKGTALGLMYHMAEGGGTVGYLSRNPPRGVSVHAVCEYSGKVTQMLGWEQASGSLNPADRSRDKAYFGHKHLVDVLGRWWTDPNSAVLSMEIEGFAVKGPNPAQVEGAIAWGLDMKAHFSSLRGALGHADQTDTKRCPGASMPMRLVFEGVGGHGLWHPQSGPIQQPGGDMLKVSDETAALIDLVKDAEVLDLAGKHLTAVTPGAVAQDVVSPFEAELGANAHYRAAYVTSGGVRQLGLIHVPDANVRPIPVPKPGDCSGPIQAELERAAERAAKAVRGS